MVDLEIGKLLATIEADGRQAILVEITAALGSTPRGVDALMLVTSDAVAGTIGGGHLEFHAIDVARSMIAEGKEGWLSEGRDGAGPVSQSMDLPLGPTMGQCCGGHVTLRFEPVTARLAAWLGDREAKLLDDRPPVLVFGLGHTGRALASMLSLLPFAVTLVDDRAEMLAGLPDTCRVRHLEDPADAIADAPAGAAYIILTHSHALDYRLTEAALERRDAAYVGMIGSKTKRKRFESQFLRNSGTLAMLGELTCPIGGADVDDKRPEIIASLTAAELVRCFARRAARLQRPAWASAKAGIATTTG
ncbi:xanthine dehydrogenase accessory protein XdhC [Labrys okinawensis]|uniref:Xanthine dehydrogenase accessory protein XdhC n=1 Tax=Labrys okinawensis TaxID=346911 RepID=A0A2S9QGI4_9HYPH|nr:xanthine dehydrogenase accessory protein XdhC [Labrys okinawensis]PRH88467.1 xanthine dehydrogenase accessory protein XdhC [Labrys okinawensis]